MQVASGKDKSNRKIFLLLCLLAIGIILRLNSLSERSLWTDEFFTLFQSTGHGVDIDNLLDSLSKRQAPGLLKAKDFKLFLKNDPAKNIKDVTNGLLDTDTHPPLYFWIMHIWIKMFGDDAWTIRIFSVLMGVLAILLAYAVGNYLFNKQVANFCALFVSISAFAVRYSQEARAYALIMVLGLISWLFILRFEKHNRNLDIFWFSIFNALGIYAHYFYSFVAIAQFVYFTIVYRQDSPKITKLYLAILSSLLLLSPWVILVTLRGYNFRNAEWIFGYPGLINKIGYLGTGIMRCILIFEKPAILQYLFLLIGLSFFIYIAFRASSDLIAGHPRQFLFCLSLFLIPLLGMFLIDIVQHGALLRQERFWIFSFIGFIPLAGYFLSYGFLKSRKVTFLLIVLMLVSSVVISNAQFGPAPKYTSLWINRESQGKVSAVIVYNIRSAVFTQAYYLENNVYLIPVSNIEQLTDNIKVASNCVDKIFIVRYYHRTDASLMDQPFMGVEDIGSGFRFKTAIKIDDVSVSEYVRCES